MDDALLIPATGGRVRLDLGEHDATSARYAVALATPEGVLHGDAHCAPGAVEVRVDGAADWLVEWTRALLVTLAKRAADEGWPRRVVRWRDRR